MSAIRLAYGLRTLVAQIGTVRPDATFDYGEPDGLSVIREVYIDRATGKWLQPLIDGDSRIVIAELKRTGPFRVVFTDKPAADVVAQFNIPELVDEALEQAAEELADEKNKKDD